MLMRPIMMVFTLGGLGLAAAAGPAPAAPAIPAGQVDSDAIRDEVPPEIQFADELGRTLDGVLDMEFDSHSSTLTVWTTSASDLSDLATTADAEGLRLVTLPAVASESELTSLQDSVEEQLKSVFAEHYWAVAQSPETHSLVVTLDATVNQVQQDEVKSIVRQTAERFSEHLPQFAQRRDRVIATPRRDYLNLSDAVMEGKYADEYVDAYWNDLERGSWLVTFVSGTEPQALDAREGAPFRGGDFITIGNGGICTAGFVVISGSTRAIATAGHCGAEGQGVEWALVDDTQDTPFPWTDGANTGGTVADVVYEGDADVAIITGGVSTVNFISTFADGKGRYVRSRTLRDDIDGDDRVCFQGSGIYRNNNANQKCNEISKEDRTSGAGIQHTWCIERRAYGGDSGGPVYRRYAPAAANVYGLVHSALSETDLLGFTHHHMCFTTIDSIISATGYSPKIEPTPRNDGTGDIDVPAP